MKSSKQLTTKRSASPIQPKTVQISQKKKKSTSNYPNNSYKKGMKQFQTYGKTQKKSNYLKQLLRNGDSGNKYRIVTEPVQQRLLYLGNNNYGRLSNSKSKLQHDYTQKYLKLNIRTSNHSKQKFKPAQMVNNLVEQQKQGCKNCQKYKQQVKLIKEQLNKICLDKILWKNGQLTLQSIKGFCKPKNLQSKLQQTFQKDLLQIRKHFFDLMKDIQSLSSIDYPKMLSLNLFNYDPFYTDHPDHQQNQLKQLLGQLRNTMEGKINIWDLEEQKDQNQHVKSLMRNLKNRLNHYLRQNMELKIKKQILQKSEEITSQSQDYLRKVIEDVLISYTQGMAN